MTDEEARALTDPTPEALAQAQILLAPLAPFVVTHSWMEGAYRETATRIAAALTEASAHPDCHPAALCDGPETVRETWEAAAQVAQGHGEDRAMSTIEVLGAAGQCPACGGWTYLVASPPNTACKITWQWRCADRKLTNCP